MLPELRNSIKSFGLVFGDIGTSPIYTLTVIFLILEPTQANVLGVLSLVFWTLTLLVTVEYAWLGMSLSKKGEGGTIILMEILLPLLQSGRKVAVFSILGFLGISLLVGDGVITPAISILSAVEGLHFVPFFSDISQTTIICTAALIAVAIFSIQSLGTEKISAIFDPVMALWFTVLFVSGLVSIIYHPSMLKAVSPYYAISFLSSHGVTGFFVLSEVILCATGAEALYADMGHFGRKTITTAWSIIFFVLIFNYFGQGAFLLSHEGTKNILFEMIYSQSSLLYIPFLVLSLIATAIASQAMISGMFSVIYQGISTRIMPLLKVDYTSETMRSRIYIPAVNWFLLLFVLAVMFLFKSSSNMAGAYGLAVTGTMTVTGTMMTAIFYIRKSYFKAAVASFITLLDTFYLAANILKIPHGGYWSLIIASIPFVVIVIYKYGGKKMYGALKPKSLKEFLVDYSKRYKDSPKLNGTGLFFVRNFHVIPPYISKTMFTNNIIYSDNILISINITDEPHGIQWHWDEKLADGLRSFQITAGYLDIVDIGLILKETGIEENVIFYGVEDIITNKPLWKFYSLIRKVTPSFVQFYRIPPEKLHGVVTRVEL